MIFDSYAEVLINVAAEIIAADTNSAVVVRGYKSEIGENMTDN